MAAVNLAFLKGLELLEVEDKQPQQRGTKQNNPEPTSMRIRVHKDGSIYPSQALVTKYSLEYPKVKVTLTPKVKDGLPVMSEKKDVNGNLFPTDLQEQLMDRSIDYGTSMAMGLDVIDSEAWKGTKQYPDTAPRIILVGVSPKNSPKVELFSGVRYNDDGTPVSSVLTQGATTYGKETLLPLLKEVYGVEIGEQGYIDLDVAEGYQVKDKQGIYFLPKKVTRGKDAGKSDYERRENISIFPLVPVVDEVSSEPTVLPETNSSEELVMDATVLEETLN